MRRSTQWLYDAGQGTYAEYELLPNLEIETAYCSNAPTMVLTLVENTGSFGPHTANLFIDFQQMVEEDQQTRQRRTIRRSDRTAFVGMYQSLPFTVFGIARIIWCTCTLQVHVQILYRRTEALLIFCYVKYSFSMYLLTCTVQYHTRILVFPDHSMKLPIGWENIPPGQFTKEAVPPNSQEYQQVDAEFKRTSSTFTIISVCTCVVLLICTLHV